MKTILALNGSVRENSSNGMLIKAIQENLTNIRVREFDSLAKLPCFNPDLDFPDIVLKLKKEVQRADCLLISTPEYAHGIPGALKNALDWLVSDEKLPGKKTILFVCSSGDGEYAMSSLYEITKTMSLDVAKDKCFNVSQIRSKFKKCKLTDKRVREIILSIPQLLE